MAFIRHRGKTYSVVYKILDENGEEHTTSETFATQKEADKRKKEIEYKQSIGKFEVQKCATLKELIEEYVQIYGHDKWGVSTYSGNVALINNYILPTIGDTKLAGINTHFMEKYYKDLLKMPAVKSTKNPDGTGTITESTVNEIHKVLRSCFRQAVKWDMMEKNPAVDAIVPKAKKQEREIWTAEMLMQALEACDNKMLKIAFHLAFTATLRIGELLGLTWDDMDISEEAIADNKAYVIINKQVERVSKDAIEALNSKEIIMIFPSQKKNNKTVRVLKSPKTDSSKRKVFIPKSVAQCLIDLKKDQEEIIEALGNEYQNYNLVSQEAKEKLSKGVNYHGAPLAIIVCGDHSDVFVRPFDKKDMVSVDATIVADHIVLEAEDLGLSSCWLTYFDPEIIRNEFNIPSNLEPIAIIAVGYADTEKASPDRHSKDRKALESLVCYETF